MLDQKNIDIQAVVRKYSNVNIDLTAIEDSLGIYSVHLNVK